MSLRLFLLCCTSTLLFLVGACTDAPRHTPLGADARVVVLGDSIAHGTGTGEAPAFPARLAQETGWTVVNAGVPGDTAERARERLPALLERHRPQLVIVELGGNDFLGQRPDSAVKSDLRRILATIRRADATAVLMAIPELSLLRAGIGQLRDARLYAELGEEEEVTVIRDSVSRVLSDGALRADRIHPNARGHRQLTLGLVEQLRQAGLLAKN